MREGARGFLRVRVWAVVAGVIALAGATAGFLVTVQVLGPHARRPRYGAAAGLRGRPR